MKEIFSESDSKLENSSLNFSRISKDILSQVNILMAIIANSKDEREIRDQLEYSAHLYLKRSNWKAIGSGANYNISKFAAKYLIKKTGRACAFDVLENHKHIDMSAEAAVLVFICGIWKNGYQEDAYAEIKKMVAHNSLPIVFTHTADRRFDELAVSLSEEDGTFRKVSIPVVKLPKFASTLSYPLQVILVERFSKALKMIREE